MTWKRWIGSCLLIALMFWLTPHIEVTPNRAAASDLTATIPYRASHLQSHKTASPEFIRTRDAVPRSSFNFELAQDLRSKFLRAVCEMKYLDSPFRADSHSLYYASMSGDGLLILIKSSDCPEGTHSQISATREGDRWIVNQTLDCKSASKVDLYKGFRVGGKFTAMPAGNGYNFAIQGPGHFLTHCDNGFVATRSGHFVADEYNLIRDDHGCLLIDKNLQPANLKTADVTELGIVDLYSDGIIDSAFIEPGRVSLHFSVDDLPFMENAPPIQRDFLEIPDGDRDDLGIPKGLFQSVDFDRDCGW